MKEDEMFKHTLTKTTWSGLSLTLLFLLIEFFDELNFAIEGAVLPVLRVDLALSYAQVGLLLGLPHVISTLIEPAIMLLGDTDLRKRLIIAGGLGVVIAMFLIASVAITAVIYITWLLVPWPFAKITLMILLRFSTLGWYPVLQGEAYASAPGRSGTVM